MLDGYESFRKLLIGKSAVTALVGTTPSARVYHGEIPTSVLESWEDPKDVRPTIFISPGSDLPHDDTVPMVDGTIELMCFAKGPAEAAALAQAVDGAIDGDTSVVDGVQMLNIERVSGPIGRIHEPTDWFYSLLTYGVSMIEVS
jgi:hypothetical protein